MAVTIGDKIIGCDLFDKPSTCQKVWGRLLSGLVLDALETKESEQYVDISEIEKMIDTTSDADWERAEPIGEGEEYRAEFDGGVHASAIAWKDALVHGSVLTAV